MISTLRHTLVVAMAVLPVSIASSQSSSPSLNLRVDYFPDRSNAPYDFSVQLSGLNEKVSILAPNGTLFETPSDFPFNWHDFKNLTRSDLTSYIGSWTINDFEPVAEGAPPQQHTFNLSLMDLTDHPSVPRFFSPIGDALLPPVFEIKTSSGGFNLKGLTATGMLTSQPGTSFRRYLFAHGETEAILEARASNQVNDIRNATAPSGAFRRFSIWKIRDTYSPPSLWTIQVPEPSMLALGGLALLSLAALRRRK